MARVKREQDDKQGFTIIGQGGNVLEAKLADLQLVDFSLKNAKTLETNGQVFSKPGATWDVLENVILLFAYIDVDFEYRGAAKTVRIALAKYEKYQLGDILMKRDDDVFHWYDNHNDIWVPDTSDRPEAAQYIHRVRKFHEEMTQQDPDLTDFEFYPLFVPIERDDGTYFNEDDVNDRGIVVEGIHEAVAVNIEMDFKLGKVLLLPGKVDQDLTDKELITACTIVSKDMNYKHGDEGDNCMELVGMEMEEYFRGLETDEQGKPIVPEDVFETVGSGADTYHHFKPANVKFYADGRVTVDDETICEPGGSIPEEQAKDLKNSGMRVKVQIDLTKATDEV